VTQKPAASDLFLAAGVRQPPAAKRMDRLRNAVGDPFRDCSTKLIFVFAILDFLFCKFFSSTKLFEMSGLLISEFFLMHQS
jgi:hypothetical protein